MEYGKEFSRTEMLLGTDALKILSKARVAIFGIGGVGSYVAEALARSAIGSFDLIDHDVIDITNLNRQIIASYQTIGQDKVLVMRQRILSINPQASVQIHKCFYDKTSADSFDFSTYSYIVDAVDTVTAKLLLIERAQLAGVPIISCMGTGNKLNPAMLEVADIYQTSVCPLARIMRYELRRRGIKALKTVYSKEQPHTVYSISDTAEQATSSSRRQTPGSVSFVPSAAGLLIASEVVKDLIGA